MSISAEALASGGPQPLDRDTRPGLARLTRVELRKMVDTRSGFWLLLAVAGLMLLVVGLTVALGDDPDHTISKLLSDSVQAPILLLPVVGILLVTAEWTQRTGLVSFALVPRRGRVVLAKILAGLVLALIAFAFALPLAALGTAIAAPGLDGTWSLPVGLLLQTALYLCLVMLMGFGFGASLLSSAPAIVLYFGLPIAIGALGAISAIEGTVEWIDTGALALLTEHTLSGHDWGQVATASVVWIGLPLAIGLWRIRRNEVR